MKRGRFQLGAELRQLALDYINANPGAAGPEIIAALGWNKQSGVTRLQDMCVSGELRRSPISYELINVRGHKQVQRSFAYWAVCEKTRSASEVVECVASNLHRRSTVASSKSKPAMSNRDPDRKPIQKQGGQGNIGHRIRCGSTLS